MRKTEIIKHTVKRLTKYIEIFLIVLYQERTNFIEFRSFCQKFMKNKIENFTNSLNWFCFATTFYKSLKIPLSALENASTAVFTIDTKRFFHRWVLFYFWCWARHIFIVPYQNAVTGASQFIDSNAVFFGERESERSKRLTFIFCYCLWKCD